MYNSTRQCNKPYIFLNQKNSNLNCRCFENNIANNKYTCY